MSDQDLLEQISELAAREDALRTSEKQTQYDAFLTMQGQIAALVHVLRLKGIFSPEEVKSWEKVSEDASNLMKDMAQANHERQIASTYEDVYISTKKALVTTKSLCEMFGVLTDPIDKQLHELEKEWEEYKRVNE
jgi:hypothetical protein